MFGPGLPIYVRERILRRRLSVGALVGTVLLTLSFITVKWTPGPTPPHVGFRGPLVVVPNIEEIAEVEREHPTDAGGHPIPAALAAIDIEEVTPARAPDLPKPSPVGEKPREVPPVEEVTPGPAVGGGEQRETARPVTATTDDVIILKFIRPVYPTDARLLGNEGTVVVRARIDLTGNVAELESQSDDALMPSCVKAAEKAAAQWRFKPLSIAGEAQSFWVEISFKFRLGKVIASDPKRS